MGMDAWGVMESIDWWMELNWIKMNELLYVVNQIDGSTRNIIDYRGGGGDN